MKCKLCGCRVSVLRHDKFCSEGCRFKFDVESGKIKLDFRGLAEGLKRNSSKAKWKWREKFHKGLKAALIGMKALDREYREVLRAN